MKHCLLQHRSLFLVCRWWNRGTGSCRLKLSKLIVNWGKILIYWTSVVNICIPPQLIGWVGSCVCSALFLMWLGVRQRFFYPLPVLHFRRLQSWQKDLMSIVKLMTCGRMIHKLPSTKTFQQFNMTGKSYDPASSKLVWQAKLAKS